MCSIRRAILAVCASLVIALTIAVAPLIAQQMSVVISQVGVVPATTAYAPGQCLGGVLTVPGIVRPQGPGGAKLTGVSFIDGTPQTVANSAMKIFLFKSLPAGTYTDKAACAIASADLPALIGFVTINSTDCTADGSPQTRTICTIAPTLPVNGVMPITNNAIYALPVLSGTPTYGTPQTLYFNFMAEPYSGN